MLSNTLQQEHSFDGLEDYYQELSENASPEDMSVFENSLQQSLYSEINIAPIELYDEGY